MSRKRRRPGRPIVLTPNQACPNCEQPFWHSDSMRRDGYGETVHTDCAMTAWVHDGKKGPSPASRKADLDARITGSQGGRGKRIDQKLVRSPDPRTKLVTTIRPDGTELLDVQRHTDVARIVRSGNRAAQTYDQSNTTFDDRAHRRR